MGSIRHLNIFIEHLIYAKPVLDSAFADMKKQLRTPDFMGLIVKWGMTDNKQNKIKKYIVNLQVISAKERK